MGFEIYVKHENTDFCVPLDKLKIIASRAFKLTAQQEGDISLVVCDDRFITRLNQQYTGRRGPTDVLSFPMREYSSGETFVSPQENILGDIVISADTAKRQAQERGVGDRQEFRVLFTHGLLHLLGVHHDDHVQEEKMNQYTHKILAGVE